LFFFRGAGESSSRLATAAANARDELRLNQRPAIVCLLCRPSTQQLSGSNYHQNGKLPAVEMTFDNWPLTKPSAGTGSAPAANPVKYNGVNPVAKI
jgi:hypothetical protein